MVKRDRSNKSDITKESQLLEGVFRRQFPEVTVQAEQIQNLFERYGGIEKCLQKKFENTEFYFVGYFLSEKSPTLGIL